MGIQIATIFVNGPVMLRMIEAAQLKESSAIEDQIATRADRDFRPPQLSPEELARIASRIQSRLNQQQNEANYVILTQPLSRKPHDA